MLSTLEIRVDKGVRKLAGKSLAYNSGTEAEHVGVVVSSCVLCAEYVGTASGSDSFKLVCRDAHSDSRAAAKDREIRGMIKNLAAA